jgi:SAM-dependent methyltransferase
MSDWISDHRAVWHRKSGLRYFYEHEIFDRILALERDGRTLELGAGPGFFAAHSPDIISTDISDSTGAHVVADAHCLPFADGTFSNVVGIDVLHHFGKPVVALAEAARVLRNGGRMILVEPWAGPLATIFYRYIHHEDCHSVEDPWATPFADGKDAMTGNAAIPKAILYDRAIELPQRLPGFRSIQTVPFSFLSYLLTGGFQNWGLSASAIEKLVWVESRLPDSVTAFISTRALFVLEKT